MKTTKTTILKVLLFVLPFIITSCSDKPAPDPCLKNYLNDITFIVKKDNGQVYNGTSPTLVTIGELTFTTPTNYTSTIDFLGSGTYSTQDGADCKTGITIVFNTNPIKRYISFDDVLSSYDGKYYMNGLKLRNIDNPSEVLELGKKTQ